MRRVKCPVCSRPFIAVSDDIFIDIDLRDADQKAFCENCKRRIRFSEKKRMSKFDNADDVYKHRG